MICATCARAVDMGYFGKIHLQMGCQGETSCYCAHKTPDGQSPNPMGTEVTAESRPTE